MPIYEYRCQDGHEFEVMQRISDGPVTVCEVCSAPVSRVFRPIAVHFKGSGFYNTDYGTRKRSREKESGEGGQSQDGKSDGKGEAGKGEAGKGDGAKDSGSKSTADSGAGKSDSGAKPAPSRAPAGD